MIGTRTIALTTLLILSGCSPEDQPAKPDLAVENAWVRLPPVEGRPGVAYFTLRNNGPAAVLTGVLSPRVERIELHDSQMHERMMHMMPLAEVALAARGAVAFQPGGKHAMLFGVDPRLQAGGALPLTFALRDGRKVEGQAKLVAPGAPSPYAP